MKLYQVLAQTCQAWKNCVASGNVEWEGKHCAKVCDLVGRYLPSGSGFDTGTKIDLHECGSDKLVLQTSFHHTNEMGMYVGWTEHTITVTPSFIGLNVKVSGRNRNEIKDYIADHFSDCLETEID